MSDIEKIDFFKSNPFHEFVGAGFEKYRPKWLWERKINNASLYYIASGSLCFELFNKTFHASSGDVVFLKKSDIATIKNETDEYSSLYFIAFNFDETVDLGISMMHKNTGYLQLFKDILDTHRSKSPLSSMRILHIFTKLMYSLSIDNLHTSKDYILTSRIQSAAEYININYYKNISIEYLCSITGYSPAHLRRLFLKNHGVSPQDYIINKRIEIAKELLEDIPEKTIDEITDLVGISSSSYFCKLFKAKVGMSPTVYRDKRKNSTSIHV